MGNAECGMSVEARAHGSNLPCNSAFRIPHSAFCWSCCSPAAPRLRSIRLVVGAPYTRPISASTSAPPTAMPRSRRRARRSGPTNCSRRSCTPRVAWWTSRWPTISTRRTASRRCFPATGSPSTPRRRRVTTDELTHVFHLDRSRGLWSGLQHVFGRAPALFPNEYQPSWVIEGIATYYESRFTNAGRVRGSFHTQLLGADRAAAASRSPWNATLFTRWADGLVPYAYGSRFFHYLAG